MMSLVLLVLSGCVSIYACFKPSEPQTPVTVLLTVD